MKYIDEEMYLTMVRAANLGPVRDIGLVHSALARPQTDVFGMEAYPTVWLKAAALMDSLANNHALVDGNKRSAVLGTVVFLGLNGKVCALSNRQMVDLVLAVVSPGMELEAIASALRLG